MKKPSDDEFLELDSLPNNTDFGTELDVAGNSEAEFAAKSERWQRLFAKVARHAKTDVVACLDARVNSWNTLEARNAERIHREVSALTIVVAQLANDAEAWDDFVRDAFWRNRVRKPRKEHRVEAGSWVARRVVAPESGDSAAAKRSSKYGAVFLYFQRNRARPLEVMAELSSKGGIEGVYAIAKNDFKIAKLTAPIVADDDTWMHEVDADFQDDDGPITARAPFSFSPSFVERSNRLNRGGRFWCICARSWREGDPSFKILPRKPMVRLGTRRRKAPHY